MISLHGKPKRIRTDNGTEFRSKRFQLWLKKNGINSTGRRTRMENHSKTPLWNGLTKPTEKICILDAYLFDRIDYAQHLTEDWVREYNTGRPHQSLNY